MMTNSCHFANFYLYKFAYYVNVKCNILLNDLSESFNAYIKENRDKPIITTMKEIVSLSGVVTKPLRLDTMIAAKF